MNTKPLNLVILISGGGSNLQAIIDAIESKRLNARIAAVISSRADAGGLIRAKNHNIETVVIRRQAFSSGSAYDQFLTDAVAQYKPDLIVLAGFMRVLGADFVATFERKIVNIHPSLLPKFKGLNTHQRAIDAGEKLHGATVHYVTAKLDDGPIIIQAKVNINRDDTPETLKKRVLKYEHSIYPTAIQRIAEGEMDFNKPTSS